MKTYLPRLKAGDAVEGIVREQLGGGDLIISFRGDLLRVINATGSVFAAGDPISLVVSSSSPLAFRLRSGSGKRPRGFDVVA